MVKRVRATTGVERSDLLESAVYSIENALCFSREADERFLSYILDLARREALERWQANDNRGMQDRD